MKTIKATTKKGQEFINAYNRSKVASIYECYTNPSTAKVRAERDCIYMMCNEGGYSPRITGYNCMQFTFAFQTTEGLRVETASSSYIVK